MQKGIPNKRYIPEFKKIVVETMRSEHLSIHEKMRSFFINDHRIIKRWERICLEEGPEGLAVERRRRKGPDRPCKLSKEVEEDLIAENQSLRAEVVYLKNLQALVLERERRQHKNAGSSKVEAKTFTGYSSFNCSSASCNPLLLSEADGKRR